MSTISLSMPGIDWASSSSVMVRLPLLTRISSAIESSLSAAGSVLEQIAALCVERKRLPGTDHDDRERFLHERRTLDLHARGERRAVVHRRGDEAIAEEDVAGALDRVHRRALADTGRLRRLVRTPGRHD